jgi:hypothetical protein
MSVLFFMAFGSPSTNSHRHHKEGSEPDLEHSVLAFIHSLEFYSWQKLDQN